MWYAGGFRKGHKKPPEGIFRQHLTFNLYAMERKEFSIYEKWGEKERPRYCWFKQSGAFKGNLNKSL